MPQLPETAKRVEQHSPESANDRIRSEMNERLVHYAAHPEDIDARLTELDGEWDIERTLEANAATLALVGLALGSKWRTWNLLPAVVAAFLLEHAVQGWCPPVEVFRRLGVRTMDEIDEERYALKALRGDFTYTETDTSRPNVSATVAAHAAAA